MDTIILIIGVLNVVLLVIVIVKLFISGKITVDTDNIVSSVKDGLSASQRELREEMSGSVQSTVKTMGESLMSVQKALGENQADRLIQTNQSMTQMQKDVNSRLDDIRKIVDQRLQSILDEKMTNFGSIISNSQRQAGEAQKTQLETMDKKLTDSLGAMSKSVSDGQEQFTKSVQEKLDLLDKRFQSLETSVKESLEIFGKLISGSQEKSSQAQQDQMDVMDKKLHDQLTSMSQSIAERQEQSGRYIKDQLTILESRFQTLEASNNDRLDAIKRTMSEHLEKLSESNQKKLDSIQSMVSDKMEHNLRESFKMVSERLEKVYTSLGEMQTIAAGVGDLKKVLSNVKTRGIMGEIQLEMILSEILAPDLYEHEIATIPGSKDHVEYAVKLPGTEGNSIVYLPIDSKFPGDTYRNLQEAYDTGDTDKITAAKKQLETVIKQCAADIKRKYVEPPYTTNFGIMFLPFEGLYAEVVNSGLVDVLRRDFNVTITGPSTMAAMLNSLQMGFRTLAIQKRSNEVWQILGEAKGEFQKFEEALKSTQDKIKEAGDKLELLVGRRTRAINRKLRGIETIEITASPLTTDPSQTDELE